jgi:hypothetical protein
MPERGECPQCADLRVLQLLSQRRSSVAFILADSRDCSSWLSEGHSLPSRKTYLVKVRVVGERVLAVRTSRFEARENCEWVSRLAELGIRPWRCPDFAKKHAPATNINLPASEHRSCLHLEAFVVLTPLDNTIPSIMAHRHSSCREPT